MLENHFGLVEAAFVATLAIAFYVWQMRDLRREEEKARRREQEKRESDSGGT